MKENPNQKTAVCPTCGCRRPIENGEYLFVEEWEAALKAFAKLQCGLELTSLYSNEQIRCGHGIYSEIMPMPKVIREWLDVNCKPEITRDEFIHQLGVRITAIEEEKGGKK